MTAPVPAAVAQATLRDEINTLERRLAMRLAAGDLGVHPRTYAHQARLVRQARAKLFVSQAFTKNEVGDQ